MIELTTSVLSLFIWFDFASAQYGQIVFINGRNLCFDLLDHSYLQGIWWRFKHNTGSCSSTTQNYLQYNIEYIFEIFSASFCSQMFTRMNNCAYLI